MSASTSTALTPFERRLVAKKGVFFGRTFRLLSPEGHLRFFVKQKAFRLKEDLTVYGDEAQTQPMLRIRARSRLDVSATYDVIDVASGQTLGAWRRQGLKSMLRDTWTLLEDGDKEIGKLEEDSMMMAIVRRFLANLIPQSFTITVGGKPAGKLDQRFNPFQLTYDVTFDGLDPRMGVAITVLVLAIEGRQQ